MLNSVDFVDPTSNPHANKGILEWSFFNNRPSNIYISLEISNFRSVIIEILVPECKICRKINSIFIQVCRTIFVTRFKMRVFLRHWFKNDMVSKWKELETNYDHIRVSIDVFPACSASGILQDREILSQYEYTNLMEDYFPSMMRIPHDVWGDSPRYTTKLFRSTLLTSLTRGPNGAFAKTKPLSNEFVFISHTMPSRALVCGTAMHFPKWLISKTIEYALQLIYNSRSQKKCGYATSIKITFDSKCLNSQQLGR